MTTTREGTGRGGGGGGRERRTDRFRPRKAGATHDLEISDAERRVLMDEKEVARERASGLVDDQYSMAATFDDFKNQRRLLIEKGLLDESGDITVAGMLALEVTQ